jgi:polar amino acid transport system substrate-binding protein
VKNLRTIRAALTASLLLLFASSAQADRLDEIKSRGKLVVGVSDTTPPFSFRKPADGTLTGYDLDLVRAVAKRMGLPLEMVPSRAPSAFPCCSRAGSISSPLR